jgi:hypothetical protein
MATPTKESEIVVEQVSDREALSCGGAYEGADPPDCRSAPAIAALQALQIRPEDLAAAGLEVGMWPV